MQPDTSASPPAKPIVRSYPTPDLRDRVYVESRDNRLSDNLLPEQGSPYEGREAEKFEGWVFATAVPSDKVGWTDHYYLNERANQDAYNFTIEYPWVDRDYPRVTRTYLFLRSDARAREPEPHVKDSVFCECVMIDWKVVRLEDNVQDSIFIGVTKTFERVPAPVKVVLDRPESVLPFNQRVAVPAVVETTVEEDATDGDTPAIIQEEDWHVEETSNTAFRKTVDRAKRKLPPGGSFLDKAETLTRQQQLGQVTSNWQIGPQVIVPRATLTEATVTDVGNNTTILEQTEVPRVFPAGEFRVQIPDNVPPEFRDLLPTRTTGITGEGQAGPRDLGPGELERISRAETELIAREEVTGRDLDQLPKTLVDQELNGIQTHGASHAGVFDIERTLDRVPQAVEEGFGVIRSKVTNLGSGLTARETERLASLQGAHLLLTNPGRDFTCDPAVVFSSGTIGSGAQGAATISAIPGGSGVGDPGGVFPLTFSSFGDDNGLFNFLGERYNSGVWQNPAAAGVVSIGAVSNQPISAQQLALLVDREPSTTSITMQAGGSHLFAIDLRVGREIQVSRFTIRAPSILQGHSQTIRIEGTHDLVNFTNLTGNIIIPATPADAWVSLPVSNIEAWRYFRIFRTDTNATNAVLSVGEIEIYGTLTITPAAELRYSYDGDSNGVFNFLGQRGGNGIWRNPSANGDIVASADGLAFGTVEETTDRQPSNVYTDGTAGRAFYWDLKAGRSLVCNKLSYRERSEYAGVTASFYLQGRNDLGDPGDWTTLVVVQPSAVANAWTSVNVPGTTGYRQFRIYSPDPYLTIGELELYGALVLGAPSAASGGVTGITVISGGANYLSTPEVRITGGSGTGATAMAVVVNGAVVSVTVTNPGTGYTSVPTVSFFVPGGGFGAAATSTLTGDAVTSIAVTSPGAEYGAVPEVDLVGDGTGATAHAIVALDGMISSVVVDTGGTGYTVPPAVLFRNAGGPTAVAVVGYPVDHVVVNNKGGGFTSPPAIGFVGDGISVQAQAVLGFPIASIVMNTRGQNYTSTPAVIFTGTGTGAAGTAIRGFAVASVTYAPNANLFLDPPTITVSGGGIFGAGASFFGVIGRPLLTILVGVQGSNYTSDPGVVITGDGTGATADSVRSFALASITTDTGGSDYVAVPSVTIAAPTGINGVQATAHAILTAGVVTSIVLDNPGFGYKTAPVITINGDGTGAGATAVLETSGVVDSIIITNSGANYTTPPTITLSGGGGSDAELTATLNTAASGLLLRVEVVNPGLGYTSAPFLTIPGGVNTFATLETSGQIVAVTITNAGNDYTIPASIGFVGGGGSGATASGLLATGGRIRSVTMLNTGFDFTSAPTVTITGGGGTGAIITAVLGTGGRIKTLTLIDPGPEYAVAPLVSFFGCDGVEATALYILGTGWPILYDIVTDPVEKLVVNIEKKIVPAGSQLTTELGFVDILALDTWRSIQITSKVDLTRLPPPEIFGQTHVLNLPPLLLSVGAVFSEDVDRAIRINTGFGSASVKSTVSGKIVVHVQDGYRGPAKASVTRTFMFGPPPAGATPSPLIITPATGTAYLTTQHKEYSNSGGTTGGFAYVELHDRDVDTIDTLDISGVLTGGLAVNISSGPLLVEASGLAARGTVFAQNRGIFDPVNIGIAVADAQVTSEAHLNLTMPLSCPRFLNPGTTFLLSAGVEKWRFGIYVQTLIYVTIPTTACIEGGGGY